MPPTPRMTKSPSTIAGRSGPLWSATPPAPVPGEEDGCVAPPTAVGVDGGLPVGVGLADGELRGDRNGLAAGERLGEGLGVVAAGGLGVGFEVGVGGTVTVMLPPGADAPVDAMNVTVHVPADRTRADLDQVWPEGGAVSAIEIGAAPLRVSRAVMDVGLGLP